MMIAFTLIVLLLKVTKMYKEESLTGMIEKLLMLGF